MKQHLINNLLSYYNFFFTSSLKNYKFFVTCNFKGHTISLSRCALLLSFLYMYTSDLSAVILYCMFSFLVNFIFLSLTFFTLYLILYYLWFGETNKMKWKKFLFPMWVMLTREFALCLFTNCHQALSLCSPCSFTSQMQDTCP